MKKGGPRPLTPQEEAELATLAELSEAAIDTSDAPEIRDWSSARRGLFYRPIKQQLTLRLDADLIAWFRKHATKGECTTPVASGRLSAHRRVSRQFPV